MDEKNPGNEVDEGQLPNHGLNAVPAANFRSIVFCSFMDQTFLV